MGERTGRAAPLKMIWFFCCLGFLLTAALLGVGNGAVFKIVPQYFPASTSTVTAVASAVPALSSAAWGGSLTGSTSTFT